MNWKQKIAAQIAALHDAAEECDSGEADFYTGAAVDQAADNMQALLDVAVAAENSMFWLHNGIVSMQKEEWDKIVDALDKLREVGDE